MLRSGMTHRESSRMMRYECLMYGTKGLMFGLPAAMQYYLITKHFRRLCTGFFLPWPSVVIAVGSVFVVVFATMVYATASSDENTADALKNENI